MKTLKVFAPAAWQADIASHGQLVQHYDAFVVVQVSAAAARKLRSRHPCEDLTDQYRLRLGGKDVDPLQARLSRGRAKAVDDQPHHHLVQFIGPVKTAWIQALRAAGATRRCPSSGFSWVVLADAKTLTALRALPFVRWVGHLQHGDRMASSLKGDGLPRNPRVTVEVFAAQQVPTVAEAAASLGFRVLGRHRQAKRVDLEMADVKRLKKCVAELATVHGVARIAPYTRPKLGNTVAGRIVGRPFASGPRPGLGLHGQGEIVAVCDTGLDTGHVDTLHPDLADRVLAILSYPIAPGQEEGLINRGADDGPADTASGHGTHVAGSIVGTGRLSQDWREPVVGMAPQAQLVFQAMEQRMHWPAGDPRNEDKAYWMSGLPRDLTRLFRDAYAHGARIHNNSWTGDTPDAYGSYDIYSRQVDQFVHRHPDFLVLFAVGNEGSDTGGKAKSDGRINPRSLTPPSTAKNCITVGACESLRPRFAQQTYGTRWPQDYPQAPQNNDHLADDPDTVAAFSARGPCNDGRSKPDVLAPGTLILSTRSSLATEASDDPDCAKDPVHYTYMTGTSMATPIASGCAALLREALRKRHGVAQPSAALIKALMIAGCVRLPSPPELRHRLVDSEQGFGRINLQRSLEQVLLVHEGKGLSTGAYVVMPLSVPPGQRTLRLAMAYTDAPLWCLANNLNLFALSPEGEVYLGNQRGAYHAEMTLDAQNNVEVIEVPDAAAGAWAVAVVGSNVPQGPQNFALVAVMV